MRRSIVLAAVIAASTAIFGACDPKAPENKPPVTSTPVSTPVASPTGSPVGTPVNGTPKTNASPEVKKDDVKKDESKPSNVNKDQKPAANK